MAQILGFSPELREALRPLSVRVLRQATESVPVLVHSLKCSRCGYAFEFDPPRETLATGIEDCEWSHRFSWETGKQCGGQVMFVTSPRPLLMGL